MEDKQIIELYLRRNETAIAETEKKYGKSLRTIADKLTEDVQTTWECENDTYLAAWNAIPPHKPWDYLFAFLARIIRHIALDRCKELGRQKRNGYIVPLTSELEQCIPAAQSVEEAVNAKLLAAEISAFLWTVPEDRRNVFLRRYWYMDDVKEIAKRFGFRESNVKTMLFRTRNELRQYLEERGYQL